MDLRGNTMSVFMQAKLPLLCYRKMMQNSHGAICKEAWVSCNECSHLAHLCFTSQLRPMENPWWWGCTLDSLQHFLFYLTLYFLSLPSFPLSLSLSSFHSLLSPFIHDDDAWNNTLTTLQSCRLCSLLYCGSIPISMEPHISIASGNV